MIPSLDPRYPLGKCKTNGRVPVTSDEAEANRLALLYQAQQRETRA